MSGVDLPAVLMSALADGVCLTIDELTERLDPARRIVGKAIGRLTVSGLIERHERGCYRLSEAGIAVLLNACQFDPEKAKRTQRSHRPRLNTLRQRAWNAMRLSATFTIADIVIAAARPDDRSPEMTVRVFVRQLRADAYVVELPMRTMVGAKRYRLLKNTGEIAPVWSHFFKRIIDHNGARP